MSLTWHIVRKDLRRIAIPAGVWLAAIVAGTVWFARTSITAGNVEWRVGALGWMANVMQTIQWLFAAVLSAVVVHEDVVPGTHALWLTRPLRASQLFLAKTLTLSLVFVVAPVLVLLPVWLGHGFAWQEVAIASAQTGGPLLFVVIVALALASLTRNLRQFCLAFAALVAASALLIVLALRFAPADARLVTFGWAYALATMATGIGISAFQYTTRRTHLSVVLAAVGFSGSVVFACFNPPEKPDAANLLASEERVRAPSVPIELRPRTTISIGTREVHVIDVQWHPERVALVVEQRGAAGGQQRELHFFLENDAPAQPTGRPSSSQHARWNGFERAVHRAEITEPERIEVLRRQPVLHLRFEEGLRISQ